ncbi:MAG: co-chaperone GroES [Candidatus Paraimprobicoccus trichonymphae]|uniref:Co-chaperonin GroES n=1 Tax=Candidatus Paraimprobicoccus trichonymphae TaxID=3033793 RepID=A0AA48KWD4_9FIRM|nr:MAG: co-chaperone GroES [Candidatus Paraimprobicoccus trichonymphae]
MAKIKPLLDKILAKKIEENSTKSGIILAGKSKEQPLLATVIERGPGGMVDGKEVKMYINPGDKIIIGKYAGTEVTIDNVDYVIVSQSEVLATVF